MPMQRASKAGFSLDAVARTYTKIARSEGEKHWIDDFSFELNAAQQLAREQAYQALSRGAEWILSPLAERQPRSYRAMHATEPPALVVAESIWKDERAVVRSACALFLIVNGRAIELHGVTGDEGFVETVKTDGWLSLPDGLVRSWLWRVTDWSIPRILPSPPAMTRQMICTVMQGVDDIVHSFGGSRKDSGPLLWEVAERFPDIAPEHQRARWHLRCFLDTRPVGVSGPVGDQLFVRTKMRDGVVYRIRNGDVAGLHVLDKPVDAIDASHEHLLLQRDGEFDFGPWARPLP
jgi:hypothetical protein